MFEEEDELYDPVTGQPIQPTAEDFSYTTPEERAVEDHNMQQQAYADTLSSLTGIPSSAVAPIASFAQSAASMLGSITKVPGQLAYTLREQFDPEFAEQMRNNPEVRKVMFDMYSNMGPTGMPSVEGIGSDTDQFAEEAEALKVQDVDGGITANIMKGDFADAAQQTVQQVAGAIPSIMATMTGPGGLAALGFSSLGSNFDETMEAHPEESSVKMLGTSLVKAGGEIASEYVTQRIGAAALKALRGGASPEAVKQGLAPAVKRIFKDFNNEGLSEAAAELLNNGVDALAYGEEFGTPDMWKQLADSYIVGGIMGGGMSTVGQAASYTRNSVLDDVPTESNREYQIEREAAINAISKEPDSPGNQKAKAELQAELEDNINKQHGVWESMSQEETQTYLQLKKDAQAFMTGAENAASPEAADILEAKANEKIQEADALYDTVENWEGAKTEADRIEELRKAQEVANPEAVQDHLYAQRPTSFDAQARKIEKDSAKNLELSVSNIESEAQRKLDVIDQEIKKYSEAEETTAAKFDPGLRGQLNYYKQKNDQDAYQDVLDRIDRTYRNLTEDIDKLEKEGRLVYHDKQVDTEVKYGDKSKIIHDSGYTAGQTRAAGTQETSTAGPAKQGERPFVGTKGVERVVATHPKYLGGQVPVLTGTSKISEKNPRYKGKSVAQPVIVGGGKTWASAGKTIQAPIMDRLTGEQIAEISKRVTPETMKENDEFQKQMEKRHKEAESRAKEAKEQLKINLRRQNNRVKDEVEGQKYKAKLESENKANVKILQEQMAKGIATPTKPLTHAEAINLLQNRKRPEDFVPQSKAFNDLVNRNKDLYDKATRALWQFYKPKLTPEEQGGFEIANKLGTHRGKKSLQKKWDAKEGEFIKNDIGDLVKHAIALRAQKYDDSRGDARDYIFGTRELFRDVKNLIKEEGDIQQTKTGGRIPQDLIDERDLLNERIAYYQGLRESNPEEAYLYDDIITTLNRDLTGLGRTFSTSFGDYDAYEFESAPDVAVEESHLGLHADGFGEIDLMLGFKASDATKMLNMVRDVISEGGLPTLQDVVMTAQQRAESARKAAIAKGKTSTGESGSSEIKIGKAEGMYLQDEMIKYADKIRTSNPELRDLVNSYINPLMKTPEDLAKNAQVIYDLLPANVTGKNSQHFNGFFNSENIKEAKGPSGLAWGDQFKGLKAKHTATKRLRDLVANAVVDSMQDVVAESNPEIIQHNSEWTKAQKKLGHVELSVSKEEKGDSVFPIAKWMNSMTSQTGQRVIVNDNVVDQINETLPKGSRLNGFINKNTGDVYVRSTVQPKTVIHEMGHAWAATAKSFRPDLYKAGAKLALDSEYADIVRQNYPDLESTPERFEEEVLAHAIEAKGAAITDKYKKKKFIDWVNKFFDAVMENLGIKAKNPSDLTYDEFMTLAASEILSGKGMATASMRMLGQKTDMSAPEYSKEIFRLGDAVISNPKVAEQLREPILKWRDVNNANAAKNDYEATAAARSIIDVMNFLPKEARSVFAKEISKGNNKLTLGKIPELMESLSTSNHEGLFGNDVDWGMVSEPARGNKNRIKNKQKALRSFFQSIKEGYDAGRINHKSLDTIKVLMNNTMNGLLRDTAVPAFWPKNMDFKKAAESGHTREHVLPATQFFNRALTESASESRWEKLMDDYKVVKLTDADDAKLKKTAMPEVYFNEDFKIGNLPASFSRYFNGRAMIDPTQYVNEKGETMAKVMGLRPEAIEAIKTYGIEGIEFSIDPAANNDKAKKASLGVTARRRKVKQIENLLNLKKDSVYKSDSKYKKSKVTQELRDRLADSKKFFNENKAYMTDARLDQYLGALRATVKSGKADQRSRKNTYEEKRKSLDNSTKEILKDKLNLETIEDVDALTPNQIDQLAKKKDSWWRRISLAPAANNDFYGLLYNLRGKNGANEQFIKDNIINVLEDANYDYVNDKQKILQRFNAATGSVKGLAKKSGIEIDGKEITNDQAVRIFNHIKEPKLWEQMIKGGVTLEKMQEVAKYVNGKEDLRVYANEIVDIYSEFLNTKLNSKLEEHGYKPVQQKTMTEDVPIGGKELLEEVYKYAGDGSIPEFAPYTPFTAQGGEETIGIDAQTDPGSYYTVMSGNLKERTRGGKYTFASQSNSQDLRTYLRGPVRTANFLDFANNASAIFSSNNLKAMDGAFGKEWGASARDALQRIVTGQATPSKDKTARVVNGWINGTIGGIMFLNMRSAALQLLSAGNYLVTNPQAFISGLGKGYGDAMKAIYNSNWMKERGSGKTQLETAELFENESGTKVGKAIRTALEKGYFLTKAFDKAAIALGGAAFLNGRYKQLLAEGHDKKYAFHKAMKEFIAKSEESQQSTRQERLGRQQTSGMGRAILAFANTPMQYNRMTWKAIKDIRSGKNVGNNLARIGWFMAAQNALFTLSQQALWGALDLEDEEEVEGIVGAANSMVDTILRGSGIYGALASTLKNIAHQAYKADPRKRSEKAVDALLNSIPGLGTKVRQLKNTFQAPYYAKSEADLGRQMIPGTEVTYAQAANAASFLTNAPVWRMLDKMENVSDVFASELDNYQKALRAIGYSKYTVDRAFDELGKDGFDFDFDIDFDTDFDVDFDSGLNRNDDSPLNFLGNAIGLINQSKRNAGKAISAGQLSSLGGIAGAAARQRAAQGGSARQAFTKAEGLDAFKSGGLKGLFGLAKRRRAGGPAQAVAAPPGGLAAQASIGPQDSLGKASLTPADDAANAQAEEQAQQIQQLTSQISGLEGQISDQQDQFNTDIEGVRDATSQAFQQAAEGIAAASPMKQLGNGELGQAHNDGTIEVAEGLSPIERKKTINHEQKHVDDMKSGKLNYDDNYIYWNGKKFPRKDGKVKQGGKWKPEGDKSFPWEKVATKAEGGPERKDAKVIESPMKQTGTRNRDKIKEREAKAKEKYGPDAYLDPNYRDYKRKNTLMDLYATDETDSPEATSAKEWVTNWEFDPETQKRWAESETGVDENRINQAVHRAQVTPVSIDDERVESKGLYNPYKDQAYISSKAGEDTIAHELVHAGGLDAPRGAHALDILGPGLKVTDQFGNRVEGATDYVTNPQEVGAFLMQARHQLGLKPGQEVTREMLESLYSREEEVPNMLIRAAGDSDKMDQLVKAFNTVAYEEAMDDMRRKKSLHDLYSNDNTGYA